MTTCVMAAAIHGHNGVTYFVERPGRHHNVIRLMHARGQNPKGCVQGFLLSDGTFVDRVTAREVATKAAQLLPRDSGHRLLFSEDVW